MYSKGEMPVLERRGQREHLERGAGLHADGAAHVAADVVVVRRLATARRAPGAVLCHREHVPRARLHHRDGRRALARVLLRDVLRDRLVGAVLGLRVEGRADGVPAAAQEGLALLRRRAEGRVLADRLDDVVAEERRVGRRAAVRRRRGAQQRGHRDEGRAVGLVLADEADLGHAAQDDVAPDGAQVGVAQRVVGGGLVDDAGKGGGFCEVEVGGRLGEVAAGGGLDAVGAGPEVRDVEIALEDLALGEDLLEAEGVPDLAELAGGAVAARGVELVGRGRLVDEHVLDVLHREGRAALLDAAGLDVRCQRPHDAAQVDAVVVEEARVLDGDRGLPHDRGDARQRHLDPVLVVQRGQDRAVGRQDEGPLRQGRRAQGVGQVLEVLDDVAGDDAHAADERHQHEADEDAGDDRGRDETTDPGQDPDRPGPVPGGLLHAHQTLRVGVAVPATGDRLTPWFPGCLIRPNTSRI